MALTEQSLDKRIIKSAQTLSKLQGGDRNAKVSLLDVEARRKRDIIARKGTREYQKLLRKSLIQRQGQPAETLATTRKALSETRQTFRKRTEQIYESKIELQRALERLNQEQTLLREAIQVHKDLVSQFVDKHWVVDKDAAERILRASRDVYSHVLFEELKPVIEALRANLAVQYPELGNYELRSLGERRRQRELQIFPMFYDNQYLAKRMLVNIYGVNSYSTQVQGDLASQSIYKSYLFDQDKGFVLKKNIENLSAQESFEEYFSKHSVEYTQKLDTLLLHSGKDLRTFADGKKSYVAIAAMNEVDLELTLEALRKDYGEGFESEVGIIIYNNYKAEAPMGKVTESLQRLNARLSNVIIVNERVPMFNTTGMAKKTASDLVLFLQHKFDQNLPLFMCDGDVVGMTQGTMESCISTIHSGDCLAASPEFSYDRNSVKDFPVLNLLYDIKDEIANENRAQVGSEGMTYGMFYCIDAKTLASVGGIDPTAYFEDKELTQLLKKLGKHASEDIVTVIPGHFSYITPDREITAIKAGMSQWARWMGEDQYTSVVGSERGVVGSSEKLPPELSELTESNLVVALNNAVPFVLPQVTAMNIWPTTSLEVKGQYLVEALLRRGIQIPEMTVISVDIETGKMKDEIVSGEQFLQNALEPNQTSKYAIAEILSVIFTT